MVTDSVSASMSVVSVSVVLVLFDSAIFFTFLVTCWSSFDNGDPGLSKIVGTRILAGFAYTSSQNWVNHGGDLYNRRYAEKESKIGPETVSRLRKKWEFVAGKDITATPVISDGTLYFPSWNGNIYAVNASDGSLAWEKNLGDLTGLNATGFNVNVNWTVSRASPTIADDLLIIGIYGPAIVIAVERLSGELVWSTQLDNHATGVITMSGTYYKRKDASLRKSLSKDQVSTPFILYGKSKNFYVGTSSQEESLSIEQCCTFRGSLAKLDVRTGKVLWQTFTLPDNFGQKASTPEEVSGEAVHRSMPLETLSMLAPGICIRLLFVLSSGSVSYLWFFACNNLSTPNCPPGQNPDADFAEAPMITSIKVNGTKRDIVVAVQKSGFAWALNRDNGGRTWWSRRRRRSYGYEEGLHQHSQLSIQEFYFETIGNKHDSGWMGAMDDANSGEILWSTADPSNSMATGPVTVANGVVFAGSTYKQGPIYAIDAENGRILWSYETGATVYGGMSVNDGCVYVCNGYKVNLGAFFPTFSSGTSLFAFCVQDV
ncbi:putative WRKY transcription factor 72-like [Hibiscus syriacus]|uniref:WRKY transcription factor 72-like n=1 Tax=Hibiscus syriacus TaxID=106335 RepID=A0A6A2ZXN6_HIBSY|nr:putative WRKY transcription factor 72-like [Hibiscus syriacus]